MSVDIGERAPEYTLPDTTGEGWSLTGNGDAPTVLVFTCNHCPYALAWHERIADAARDYADQHVRFLAINANDVVSHPEDSPANMKAFAAQHGFPFPYLFDESQATAHAYGAVCTPEFFGISRTGTIEYRGRLDQGRTGELPPGARRELVEAMRAIAATGKGPAEQVPSVGCSIKWKQGGAPPRGG